MLAKFGMCSILPTRTYPDQMYTTRLDDAVFPRAISCSDHKLDPKTRAIRRLGLFDQEQVQQATRLVRSGLQLLKSWRPFW